MSELKITGVEAKSLKVPLARAIGSANSTKSELDYLVVFLHTEDGPTGCGFVMGLGGETSTTLVPYIEKELAPLAVGQDALAPEALWMRLWGPNKPRMRGGLGVQALSAIDTACWDALAKAAGLPLSRILGGFRNTVPVYGSGGWLTFTDAEMVDECMGFMEKGIGTYKLKLGTNRDEERIRTLRDEVGESVVLLADANQKYNPREALEVAAMLAEYDVRWFEEPVLADSVDDLADVAGRSPVPVAAGENAYMRWGFREICERRAAAYLQPDVGRCGGVTEFRKAAHLAEAYNPREALEVAAMLAEYDVRWFEEPVLADSVDDLADVAERSLVPVAAGENAYMRWGFREICERRAAAYLQPDVGRCGGVTEFRKAAHLAEAYNLSLCAHLLQEVSVSLLAATPSGYMVEYVEMLPPETLTREFAVSSGCMAVPDVPGHGVEFTEDAIRRYSA